MKQIKLKPDLDMFDRVKEIIMHPSHKDKMYNANRNYANEILKEQGIFIIEQPKIVFSNMVKAQDRIGPWERTNKARHRLIEWVDDISNPPSWAVYFGLVERALVDVCYIIEKPRFNFYRNNVDLLPTLTTNMILATS